MRLCCSYMIRLHHCKLFRLLIKRKLPAYIIRLLVNINDVVRVAWRGVMSVFWQSTVNGVKHGVFKVLCCSVYNIDVAYVI